MKFDLKDVTAEQFRIIWDANGKFGPGKDERIEIRDALSVPNAPQFFPKVISNIVREAVEPLLVATGLLQRVSFGGYGQTIVTFGATGALYAADIPEGGEYPERSMQYGPGTVTASIGKSGLAVKITEEMIRYNQFDIIGMHLRAAGRALARHKEEKVFNMIRTLGTTVFDNINPTKSVLGVCTGRDLQGNANGAATVDDIFDAYAQCMMQGFLPNTIMMHPLTWTMWVKDAQLRAFVQANGGGTFFANVQNASANSGWQNGGGGTNGPSPGQALLPGQTATGASAPHGQQASPLLSYPQTLATKPTLPSYLGVPFNIIVSPFVPYNPAKKLTDIYMFDSNELGVLIVDEEITTEQWSDPARDMQKIKLRERYGMAMVDEGQGVVTLKNVHVVPNEIILPAQTTIDVSGSQIAKIAPDASISL